MMDYLKQKVGELEGKLRESQEKGLAFAYELKGKEEAGKESRREMEEFLAAAKQQQAAAETERTRAIELERARARIEALEQKIIEFTSKPPAPPAPPAPKGLPPEELDRLLGVLKSELSEVITSRLEADVAARAKDLEALAAGFSAALENEAVSREAFREELRKLSGAVSAKGDILESAGGSSMAAMRGAMSALAAELKAVGERSVGDSAASRAAAADAVSRISAMETSFRAEFTSLASACAGLNQGLSEMKSAFASSAPDTEVIAGKILAFLEGRGREDADTAACRARDLGYISASLDNLERSFLSAADTLRWVEEMLRKSAGMPALEAASLAGRQAAILADAAREMTTAMQIFRSMRAEALKPIRDRLNY